MEKRIINEFKNKNILITGGTGSIGTGLIKQLEKCKPKAIRILTNDENSVFESRRILGINPKFTFIIGDVRDRERLNLAIRDIDIVFHAAAMKHIDVCEQNPFDAVKTNVIGTSNILEASLLENVSKFVLISTDKATNPTSTLGASKLLAERLTLNANSYKGRGKTVFSIARFGNVIGSRGSVFQIFLHQLRNDLPLMVTDTKMTRYIMSISEAAKMILKITCISKGNEIFILKMPSVKIENLAYGMKEVFEKKFNRLLKSKIKISKARQGEKLNELLVSPEEIPYCHDIEDMFKISKIKSPRKISTEKFSSETAPMISQKELHKIINELLDEYF